jgi:D-alanine-D-alanine ligase
LFVKPVAEGSSKGIDVKSYVQAAADLRYACERVWHIYDQPALVETYLPGREFTVGVFGTGAAAEAYLMEIKPKPWAEKYAYSFENKEADQIEYNLTNDAEAERAKRIALQAWHVLGCRDAGRVDVRADANGNPHFIEVNPLAGLHPAHSNLILLGKLNGLSYDEMIGRILSSATARLSVSSLGT